MTRRALAFRIVGSALAVALFFSAQNALVGAARHRPFDWQWDVYHEFVYWLTWAAVAPVIVAAARRWPLALRASAILPHLGVMLLLAPAQITATYSLHYLILHAVGVTTGGATSLMMWLATLAGGIVWGSFTGSLYYWVLLGIHTAFRYQRMYQEQLVAAAELEGRLASAQLEALRLQLHPHFLFNTLNAVSAFVGAEPEQARRMLSRLGELLRGTLDRGEPEIPLGTELALLAPYLEIQRIRFGDRLRIEVQVAPEAERARVPTLMLQPLLENAMEHGVSRRPGAAVVSLTARQEGERLVLTVSDDGPGPAGGGEGIGLRNTRERLQALHGDRHRMELVSGATGGAVLRIELPFRLVAPA
jgi:two-component system LytT family sensor kinase